MSTRLTPLDASFLHLETGNAHMHVGWRGVFAAPEHRPRPTLEALRASIGARLDGLPRFRQRLKYPPPGFGDPVWVDDAGFDIASHVTALAGPDELVTPKRFGELTDAALSEPLDRVRPLWHVHLVPRLSDGRVGIVTKIHHAMVDGKSAVEVALLLFDLSPDAVPEPHGGWDPAPAPGASALALGALADSALESFRAARTVAGLAGSPRRGVGRVSDTLRRAAFASEEMLRPAPSSHLNVPIGPRRTLVRYRASLEALLAVKAGAGATLNDVCLATVTGAMREFALGRGDEPAPLKAMVPVSVRAEAQRADLGNRISFAFIDLPVDLGDATERVARITAATSAFKRRERPAGTETVMNLIGLLPAPLKAPVTRLAAAARTYNLTVSNVPGPRFPVYLLGAELLEAYPVVPVPENHALSVGIFTYRDAAFFGIYADPVALPDAPDLAPALDNALRELAVTFTPSREAVKPLPQPSPRQRPSRPRPRAHTGASAARRRA
jgi:WS/DGAT/MGAT family acyltransferase